MCLLTETRALSAQGEKRALVGNLTMPLGAFSDRGGSWSAFTDDRPFRAENRRRVFRRISVAPCSIYACTACRMPLSRTAGSFFRR